MDARRRPWSRTWMLALVAFSLALLLATLTPPRAAFACSCVPSPPPEQALDEADAVFAGEVVRLEPDGEWIDAHIHVTEVWKGDVHEVVEVRTHSQSATCGYPFDEGRADIVYASADGEGRLSTHLCTRNAPISAAQEDLDAFGGGDAPLPGSAAADDTREWVMPAIAAGGLALVAAIALWALRHRSIP